MITLASTPTGQLAQFRVNSRTDKLAPEETRPHFNVSKYESGGEKSVYWVKNIERMGETIYLFKVTLFPSKKRGFLSNFRHGTRGEFVRGRV